MIAIWCVLICIDHYRLIFPILSCISSWIGLWTGLRKHLRVGRWCPGNAFFERIVKPVCKNGPLLRPVTREGLDGGSQIPVSRVSSFFSNPSQFLQKKSQQFLQKKSSSHTTGLHHKSWYTHFGTSSTKCMYTGQIRSGFRSWQKIFY